MSAGSPLLLAVAAGFVGLLGVLIKYAGAVRLIAGYDPDRVTDEAGLAAFIGTNTLYVAALLMSVAVVEYTDPFDGTAVVWIVFTISVIGLAARMIVGSRRYETSE